VSCNLQCPYARGPAVYQARAFISMFTDTISYNDETVCLQSGIYREQVQTNQPRATNQIRIIPNPANQKVEIRIGYEMNSICFITMIDHIGRVVLTDSFDCKVKSKELDTSSIPNGIYTVYVNTNMEQYVGKLVIVH
jgi:hypothetical protein